MCKWNYVYLKSALISNVSDIYTSKLFLFYFLNFEVVLVILQFCPSVYLHVFVYYVVHYYIWASFDIFCTSWLFARLTFFYCVSPDFRVLREQISPPALSQDNSVLYFEANQVSRYTLNITYKIVWNRVFFFFKYYFKLFCSEKLFNFIFQLKKKLLWVEFNLLEILCLRFFFRNFLLKKSLFCTLRTKLQTLHMHSRNDIIR